MALFALIQKFRRIGLKLLILKDIHKPRLSFDLKKHRLETAIAPTKSSQVIPRSSRVKTAKQTNFGSIILN
jgi:hypothetical protein